MKNYAQNQNWNTINQMLPVEFQMAPNNLPVEEIWEWNGNKIHLDRYPNPTATHRLFLHHGVGTNGRQMNLIFGHKMAQLGYDVIAFDNLGYGMTQVNQKNINYSDWVHAFADFVNHETQKDYKKPILFGLSAGGMLAYNAACLMDEVHGIIGLCFLQNDNKTVGNLTAKYKNTNWFLLPIMKILSKTPLKTFLISMKAVSKMNLLVNNPEALPHFLSDKTSAGASVQLQFLYSYMTYKSAIPVESFNKCPILLTQPENDFWTPLELSQLSMHNCKAPFTIKILEKGGHFPMELTALQQLIEHAKHFIQNNT
jgi:alpha-beta hydrolase superfamily lysophospholipase